MARIAVSPAAPVLRGPRSWPFRLQPTSAAGVGFLVLFLVIALLGPALAPYDPFAFNMQSRLSAPEIEHLFGTDEMGRDLFSRVLAGARISLEVGLIVLAISIGIGVPIGLTAGYGGGRIDNLLMRITDIFLGFPPLILAMVISVAMGGGLFPAVLGVSLAWWPGYARLVRGQVLSVKEQQYVEAARALGVPDRQIVQRHILPHVRAPIIVKMAADFGYAVLATAGLSFIGLGAKPPSPEWGAMLLTGRNYFLDYWWYSTFPGLAIVVVVLGCNLLGDALQNYYNPRRRGKAI